MRKLDRSTTYRITETVGLSGFVGQKCRVLLTAQTQDIQTNANGFLCGLKGYMMSGKFKEQTVALPPCKLKATISRNCHCNVYEFPHAPGLGKCQAIKKELIR